MSYLIVGSAIVGGLASLNLLLTLGVVRRLRDHPEQLRQLRESAGYREESSLVVGPGRRPGPFTATTVAGQEVSERWLVGPTLVGFFMPGCAPCQELLPQFVAAAEATSRESGRVLAVIAGPADEAAEYVAALRDVAHVVVEEFDGPIHRAFEVQGWPAVCRLDGTGLVVSSSRDEVLAELVSS